MPSLFPSVSFFPRSLPLIGCLLFLIPMTLLSGGCAAIGAGASRFEREQKIEAAYKGLAKQKVGIMVWADDSVLIDHPTVQPDVARGLQGKLQLAADEGGADETKKITWVNNDLIITYQQAHPEIQTESPERIAPRLGLTRLIYIEVIGITLHPADSVDLTRGQAIANIKVIEVQNGVRTAYTEENITGIYPPKAGEEGVSLQPDDLVYRQSVDRLTTEIAKRFFTHEADAE